MTEELYRDFKKLLLDYLERLRGTDYESHILGVSELIRLLKEERTDA